MSRGKRLVALLVLLILCVAADQLTKVIAIEQLQGKATISMVGDMLRILYAENRGAFLGIGSEFPSALRVGVSIFIGGALLGASYLAVVGEMGKRWSGFLPLAFIIAGGIGNMIDRIQQGYVVDFLNVGIGSLRTGIFNVADLLISTGCVWLLITSLRSNQTETTEDEDAREITVTDDETEATADP